eukprot:Selendium_serpulae@DN5597_c1_g1_i1.p2
MKMDDQASCKASSSCPAAGLTDAVPFNDTERIRVGDFVELKRPEESDEFPWIVQISEIKANAEGKHDLHCCWAWHPEEFESGTLPYRLCDYGSRERIMTNSKNWNKIFTVVRRVRMLSFEHYMRLSAEEVKSDDPSFFRQTPPF